MSNTFIVKKRISLSQLAETAILCWSFLFLMLIAGVRPALADDLYGRIRGNVTDASGAVVPAVEITATNVATNLQRQVTSNSSGSYELINLPVGSYVITANKAGFKSFKTSDISLNVNQVFVQNVQLQVGEVSESVTVEADPTQVETTNTQLETLIKGDTIVSLPLNGRNWIQLQTTIPGVVGTSSRFGSNFATNGSQAQQNSYLVNGTDTNDLPLNTPLIIPSPDAIGEFNLVTNTINPEYGRNSGAVLNAVIKSGTNSFHGSAFDFYRDTFLNSKNYFKSSKDIFHQNQFGGTIGGPVWKNHTFFFFSYQGTRNRQPQNTANTSTDTGNVGNSTVFTSAERGGLFPDLATSTATSPFPLVGENGTTFPANTAYSTIFPTGHIPAADINSISAKFLSQFIPVPNSGSRQFLFNPIQTNKQDQEIARVDHSWGQHDLFWGSALIQAAPQTNTLPFLGADLPGFTEDDNGHSKQITASWNHFFSPDTLNELRLGYTRLNFDAVRPDKPILPSAFGFTGINPQISNEAGLPTIVVNGGGPNFSVGFSDDGPQPRIDQTYQLTDNFSKVLGRHSFKVGLDVRRFLVKNPFSFQNNGHFDFTGTGPYSTGLAGADFLLGIPDDYSQNSGGFQLPQSYEYYSYVQDQWKVFPNLTLNYGFGWQVDKPLEDKANGGRNINCFIPGQQSTIFPTAPAGLNFPGDKGCSSSGYSIHYDHVGPRFGFAYSPEWGWLGGGPGKTSIRGGYGIYFNRSEEEITLQNTGTPPFGLGSTGISDVGGFPSFANPFVDVNQATPTGTAAAIPNKFPYVIPAAGSKIDFSVYQPLGINVIDPNFSVPYAENFNLNIQRELPSRTILTVGYVGAVARHLVRAIELNPGLNPAGCAANPSCVANRNIQNVLFPGNFKYPGDIFGSIAEQKTDGISSYNSLQISANKQTSHGLSFLAAYTYSHSIDNGSSFENSTGGGSIPGINPFNPGLDYGDSEFDARQRFVVSYTYLIPGPKSAFLGRILGGWSVNGITTLQAGFPVFIRDSGRRTLTCDAFEFYACWDNPNQVAGSIQTFDARNTSFVNTTVNGTNTTSLTNYFFNPNNFARAPFGVIGNARRDPFHGPGRNNTDFSIFKDIKTTESTRFELRMEVFNLFNHTQFKNPSGNVNSSTFGRVTTAFDPRQVQLAGKFYF